MNDKINNLIPAAIRSVQENIFEKDEKKIPKEYKGYISSMGASIIQTGLLPTLAFFQNDEGKKAKSSYLLKAIFDVLEPRHNRNRKLIDYVIDRVKNNSNNSNTVQNSNSDIDTDKLQILTDEISDILVALKLALRTFKIDD
jgi:CRISPR-associated protein Cmr5